MFSKVLGMLLSAILGNEVTVYGRMKNSL